MRTLECLLVPLLCCAADGEQRAVLKTQGTGELQVISACQLMSQLQHYRDNVVSVTGLYMVTKESTYIGVDKSCQIRFATEGYAWPRGIDLKGVRYYKAETGQSPFQRTDDDSRSIEQLSRTYDRLKDHERIRATFVGLLLVPREYVVRRQPDGRLASGSGYGHMNAWPAQLILKAVKDIVVVQENTNDSR